MACVASEDAAGRPCRREVGFNHLLTTAPLDATLRAVGRPDLAAPLRHTSTHVIGVGLRGACPDADACWMYLPDPCASSGTRGATARLPTLTPRPPLPAQRVSLLPGHLFLQVRGGQRAAGRRVAPH